LTLPLSRKSKPEIDNHVCLGLRESKGFELRNDAADECLARRIYSDVRRRFGDVLVEVPVNCVIAFEIHWLEGSHLWPWKLRLLRGQEFVHLGGSEQRALRIEYLYVTVRQFVRWN
jgi:hypothetical protein